MKKLTISLGLLMWVALFTCHPLPGVVQPDAVSDGGSEGTGQLDLGLGEPQDCVQDAGADALPCGVDLSAYKAADAIGKACMVLRAPSMRCSEGYPPVGSCEQSLLRLTAIGTWDRAHTACVAASKTRADVRKCRVDCK